MAIADVGRVFGPFHTPFLVYLHFFEGDHAAVERRVLAGLPGDDQPVLLDAQKLASASTLMALGSPAIIANANFCWFTVFALVQLSLEYGNSSYSIYGYLSYGIFLKIAEQDIDKCYQFGQLALKLLDNFDSDAVKSRIFQVVGAYTIHIKRHVQETLSYLNQAYTNGLESGDFEYAGFALFTKCQNLYFMGQPLADLQQEISNRNQALIALNQKTALSWLELFFRAVDKLLGRQGELSSWIDDPTETEQSLKIFTDSQDSFALHYLYFHAATLKYLFLKSHQALYFSNLAEQYLSAISGFLTE